MPDESGMSASEALARSRSETRAAFENRALIYRDILEELAAEIGPERAAEVMGRAIHRRGVEISRKYREALEAGGLQQVARVFCEGSPCAGALFEPGVEEPAEGGRIVLRMTACPLVEAWESLGLPAEEVDLLCEVAAAVDYGTFEGAGLRLAFLERAGQPGASRCLLELREPGASGG